jgi:hypothetical protein
MIKGVLRVLKKCFRSLKALLAEIVTGLAILLKSFKGVLRAKMTLKLKLKFEVFRKKKLYNFLFMFYNSRVLKKCLL